MFAEIGLKVNESKCNSTKNHKNLVFLNVIVSKTSNIDDSVAHRLLGNAHTYYDRVLSMMQAGIPKHIIFQFIRFCILTKVNWGAFIDEDKYEVESLYQKIDQVILGMVHDVCIPFVIEAQDIAMGFKKYQNNNGAY